MEGIHPTAGGGGVTSCGVRQVFCCYRCQSLLVVAGSILGTMAMTVDWFSAMVMLGSVCLYTVSLWDYNIERIWICPDNGFGQGCDDG